MPLAADGRPVDVAPAIAMMSPILVLTNSRRRNDSADDFAGITESFHPTRHYPFPSALPSSSIIRPLPSCACPPLSLSRSFALALTAGALCARQVELELA